MNVYEALYTTRAMCWVRPDPIPYEVQARILDAAIRAPSGGNAQGWRFMLVDDPAVKGRLGPAPPGLHRELGRPAHRLPAGAAPGTPGARASARVPASADRPPTTNGRPPRTRCRSS